MPTQNRCNAGIRLWSISKAAGLLLSLISIAPVLCPSNFTSPFPPNYSLPAHHATTQSYPRFSASWVNFFPHLSILAILIHISSRLIICLYLRPSPRTSSTLRALESGQNFAMRSKGRTAPWGISSNEASASATASQQPTHVSTTVRESSVEFSVSDPSVYDDGPPAAAQDGGLLRNREKSEVEQLDLEPQSSENDESSGDITPLTIGPTFPYLPMDRDMAGLSRKLREASQKGNCRLEDTIRTVVDVTTVTTREEVVKKHAQVLQRIRNFDKDLAFGDVAAISKIEYLVLPEIEKSYTRNWAGYHHRPLLERFKDDTPDLASHTSITKKTIEIPCETNLWNHRIPLAIQKVADRLEGTPAEEVRASAIHDLRVLAHETSACFQHYDTLPNQHNDMIRESLYGLIMTTHGLKADAAAKTGAINRLESKLDELTELLRLRQKRSFGDAFK